MITTTTLITALVLGLLAGTLAGMLGIGGGFLFVPLMSTLLPAYGLHAAVATSAGFTVCAGLSSFLTHRRHARPLYNLLVPIFAGSILGAILGPQLSVLIPERPLAVAFALMLMTPYALRAVKVSLPEHPLVLALCGLIIGAAAAVFGIGGGVFLVPLLTQALHQDMRRAVCTSALFVCVNGSIATAGYAMHGLVAWPVLLVAAPAGILSARLGSRLSRRIPPKGLTLMLALLSTLIIARMLLHALG